MTRHSGENKLSNDHNRIARAIFASAESMGISDRQLLEELTGQVIGRLETKPALPGMEDLVSSRSKQLPSAAQIEATVKEILAVKTQSIEPQTGQSAIPDMAVETTPELELRENAKTVLEKRYLIKDAKGHVIETPEQMFRRVAKHVATAELAYDSKADVSLCEEQFFQLMKALDFLPNSPTLMNAGQELGQLSACFVIPVDDSMESIFDAVKYTALIHKSGGGTGFSFSRLRPEKDRVGSTGGVASGPVSFMKVFDTATDVIKQGGMRRGANMAILRVDHPDILEFITSKTESKALTNFNISVAVTTKFMDAIANGVEYELLNPHTKEKSGSLSAKEVFGQITEMAWRTGDPGVVFIDNINMYNPTPHLGEIESTNPCGEQPLLPFESCNLASINLSKMVKVTDDHAEIDYDKLGKTVRIATRFLDDVIDVNKFPLPQIENMTKTTRKIGLGVMGFADMLIMLRIPYNSEKALEIAENVMHFISEEATNESVRFGEKRGLFPAFKDSIYDNGNSLKPRNASRTTIAPTGTLSIIAGCSSGIEPLYALCFTKHVLDGEKLIEVNSHFEKIATREGFFSTELMQQLAEGKKLNEFENIPDWIKDVFITAHDITPEWHVRMQAAFQKHTDSAVSKTVNLPFEATNDDVIDIYMLAYKLGLKGITIYRDRSRESQVLTVGHKTSYDEKQEINLTPRSRAKITKGITERVTTGCGYIYITVNFDEEGICEVFTSLGKAGGCASAQLEATSRLISLALRSGISIASVVKHLRAIRCPSVAWEQGHAVLSCADAIASVLDKFIKENQGEVSQDLGIAKNWAGQCPECASILIYQEGCHICPSCGYTKCG